MIRQTYVSHENIVNQLTCPFRREYMIQYISSGHVALVTCCVRLCSSMKSVRSPLISPFVPLGPGQLRSPHTMYIDPNTPLSVKSDSSAMKAETLVVGGR